MYTAWHVDKYKITFKLVINRWTNEIFSLTFATRMLFSRSGPELLTHSRILFSSEYFHYKIFIHEKYLES